jgi:hypothetical protein
MPSHQRFDSKAHAGHPGPSESVPAPPAILTNPQESLIDLAGASVEARARVMRSLQRTSGNAAVSELVAPERPNEGTTTLRMPFHASIRRVASTDVRAASGAQALVPGRADAEPGSEHGDELAGLFEGIVAAATANAPQAGSLPGAPSGAAASPPTPAGAPVASAPTPAPASPPASEATLDVPVQLPDITIPALEEVGKSDAVKGAFTYSGSIARGGADPPGFGVTRSFDSKLTGITLTPKPATFEIAATLEHPIKWQVRSGTGPSGQVDIASESDSDITKANFPTVVSDLTPDMTDLNGRPPRTKFWAEDLTIKHEKVHADDDHKNAPAAMGVAVTWLNTQTAANAAGVGLLLTGIPGRFAAALLAALSTEDGEKHAYGDGAPSYKARAEEIKKKGDKDDYK